MKNKIIIFSTILLSAIFFTQISAYASDLVDTQAQTPSEYLGLNVPSEHDNTTWYIFKGYLNGNQYTYVIYCADNAILRANNNSYSYLTYNKNTAFWYEEYRIDVNGAIVSHWADIRNTTAQPIATLNDIEYIASNSSFMLDGVEVFQKMPLSPTVGKIAPTEIVKMTLSQVEFLVPLLISSIILFIAFKKGWSLLVQTLSKG